MRLAGKHAVVTGSTKGIGAGIARAFVREGALVVIHSRSAADCAAVARELGPAAVPIAADLSRSEEVRRLALDALGAMDDRVDVLVNNAGIAAVGTVDENDDAEWARVLDVNVTGQFLGMRAAFRRFELQSSRGAIVLTASIASLTGSADLIAYQVSETMKVSIKIFKPGTTFDRNGNPFPPERTSLVWRIVGVRPARNSSSAATLVKPRTAHLLAQ